MQNKKLIRFVESFVIMPILTIPMSLGSLPKPDLSLPQVPQTVFTQKQNTVAGGLLAVNQEVDPQAKILKVQADAIDAYFHAKGRPLEGLGMEFAKAAKANNLDYRLLPAIAERESTGALYACKRVDHNFFGWGSCKIGFDSDEEAIQTVASHLGGNMENTAEHYAGKTTEQILKKYNPPSIVPHYAQQVMKIMDNIGDEEVTVPTDA